MSIDIKHSTSSPSTALNKSQTGKDVGKTAGQNTAVSSESASGEGKVQEDSVSLTSSASLLQELRSEIEQQPVVNTEAVEAVSQKLADGTYEINDQRIADKILDMETKLASS